VRRTESQGERCRPPTPQHGERIETALQQGFKEGVGIQSVGELINDN
jgi:hypothetical protein